MAEERIQAEQDINELLLIKRAKLAELVKNGKDPFRIMKYDVTNHSKDILNNYDEFEGKIVSVAGRMMTKRVMGKASFCHIRDLGGDIQIYVKKDEIGEEPYTDFKKYDIGDIIGVEGEVFKTNSG
ncbi:MAG: lysine--tRNA ligase, partial [Clostridiales bacterium]|nr:lysine--tRNA ligase [Clostridiales bacterium]